MAERFRSFAAGETAKRHAAGPLCAEYAASPAEAVELYGGDFMAGFSLPDSPEFDEWPFFETERLRQQLAEALQRLITRIRAGRWAF